MSELVCPFAGSLIFAARLCLNIMQTQRKANPYVRANFFNDLAGLYWASIISLSPDSVLGLVKVSGFSTPKSAYSQRLRHHERHHFFQINTNLNITLATLVPDSFAFCAIACIIYFFMIAAICTPYLLH
jgi:hypothetical protein